MRLINVTFNVTLLLACLVTAPLLAEEVSEDKAETTVCFKVKLSEEHSAEEATKICIDEGQDACLTIQDAISSGKGLGHAVGGAAKAGIAPDTITKCAMMAGAKNEELAKYLQKTKLTPSTTLFPEAAPHAPATELPYSPTPIDEVILDIPKPPISPWSN